MATPALNSFATLLMALPVLIAQQPTVPPVYRGVAADIWLQRLRTQRDGEQLRQAGLAGWALSSESPTIAATYAALLQDRSVRVRQQAAWLLGSAGATVVSGLVEALRDPDGEVRENAARAIGCNGAAAAAATPRLIELLERQGDELDGQLAADALAAIGTAHPDAIPALLRNLVREGSPSWPIRCALLAVGEAGIPALTAALVDEQRAAPVAGVLLDLAEAGHVVDLERIARVLGDRSSEVSMRLWRVRARQDPAVIVPFLQAWLAHGADGDRRGPDITVVPAAVVHLLPAFTASDPKLRAVACGVVRATDAALPGVVLALGEALRDDDGTVQMAAAHALMVHAKDAPAAALEPLVDLSRRRIEDVDDEVLSGLGCRALGTLAAAHPGAFETLRELAAGKTEVAPWAALALAEQLPTHEARASWLQRALTAPSDFVRSLANGLPGASSAATAPAVLQRAGAVLGAAREDDDAAARRVVLWDLYHLREHAAPAAKWLAPLLADEDLELRRPALLVAENIGLACPGLFAPIFALAKGEDPDDMALGALGGFGKQAQPAIPLLIEALAAESQDRQRAASQALTQLGDLADREIEQVLAAADLGADNVDAAYFAAEAWQFRGKDAAATLAKALRSESPGVRGHAIRILANIEGLCVEAIAAARAGAQDPHWFVRGSAANAIGVLGPDEPLPAELLVDADGYVRAAARQVLEDRRRRARAPR